MKTKLIHFVLPVLLCINAGYTQPANYNRSLVVTIVASSNFEGSRLELMKMTSAPNVIIASMNEIKDGSKPITLDLELWTDENGYRLFDESLEKLGHVSFKNATLNLSSSPADTLFLRNKIEQNDQIISTLTAKIATNDNFKDILLNITDLQEKNTEMYFTLKKMKESSVLPHRIIIHLTN